MRKMFVFFVLCICVVWSNSLTEIRSKKVIRVGTLNDNPPFSNVVNGKFGGFEIELAEELGKRILKGQNGKIEIVEMRIKDRISALQKNKVDMVVGAFSITPYRRKLIDFSTPYFSVDMAVLTRVEDHIRSADELKDKTILAEEDSTAVKAFGDKGFKILECPSTKACYNMLKSGKGDGFATDNTVLLVFVLLDHSVELGVKSYGKSDFIGVGVQKGNKELLKFIDVQILNLSKEGFFKKAFNDELNPFYKGMADKKYFLLDDLYKMLDKF